MVACTPIKVMLFAADPLSLLGYLTVSSSHPVTVISLGCQATANKCTYSCTCTRVLIFVGSYQVTSCIGVPEVYVPILAIVFHRQLDIKLCTALLTCISPLGNFQQISCSIGAHTCLSGLCSYYIHVHVLACICCSAQTGQHEPWLMLSYPGTATDMLDSIS